MRPARSPVIASTAVALALATGAAAPNLAAGRTWIVRAGCSPPEDCDCASIQPCVDQAAPGDSVLVAAGNYAADETRNIDIGGPEVRLTANVFMRDGIHLIGETAGGLPLAVINAGESGIGVVANQIGAGTLFTGFTVKGGRALGAGFDADGAGMLCTGSNLTIRNNVFDSNEANGQGGAIACEIGASPLIEGNRFVDNRAVAAGGAIYCGGGAAVIAANLFDANAAREGGAVHYTAAGSITGNLFRQNSAAAGVEADLAIIDGIVSGPALLITGNVFHDNGSAVVVVAAPTTTVRENTMIRGVTGILGDTGQEVEIANNLSVSHTSAGVRWTGAAPTFVCNDVWNNPIDYDGVADPTGVLGNISEDPLHCSPAENIFTVAENSPCAPGEPGGCGQIGALAVGCEPSAVEAVSWGAIKATFRADEQAAPAP